MADNVVDNAEPHKTTISVALPVKVVKETVCPCLNDVLKVLY